MSEMLPTLEHVPAFLCCSPQEAALQMPTFVKEGATTVRALFTAPADWTGLGNILHGGFQGLLLDDIMCRVATGLPQGDLAASKELTLRYHHPVRVGKPLNVFGYLVEDGPQEITTCAEIKDANGSLLTEADGIFRRTEPDRIAGDANRNTLRDEAQPDFAPLTHWPAWTACCQGPLERLWNLHIDWRLASDRSALGGYLRFSSSLRQVPAAGILAALFDQAMGLLGRVQDHGIILTVRLQVTTYHSLPLEADLLLLARGRRQQGSSFKAQAWLQYENLLVAEASGNFSVLT